MKFYIFLSLFLMSAFSGLAQNAAMVDDDGVLLYPSPAVFYEKNVKCFGQNFRLFIDTTPSVGSSSSTKVYYWTDGEIKGTDKWNNLGLFTSTIALNNSQVMQLHPELTDKAPKIYFWETAYENAAGGCWGERKQLTNFNSSIGATKSSSACVSGIWIYPNLDSKEERAIPVYNGPNTLDIANYPKKGKGDNSNAANLSAGYKWVVWGDYVREFLSNPENTVLCWRQTTSVGETYNGNKVWRPVRIEK